MSSEEAGKDISRLTKGVTTYRLVKSRTIAEKRSIQSIRGIEVFVLFMEANATTLKSVANCCKRHRDYFRARRMVNHLVVNRLLKSSRSTLPLEARLKIRVNDWIRISNPNQDLNDSEISHEILTRFGIHVGELGILEVGAPPLLLPSPPPRQRALPNSSLNENSGLLHTGNENSDPSSRHENENSGSFPVQEHENSRLLLTPENENPNPQPTPEENPSSDDDFDDHLTYQPKNNPHMERGNLLLTKEKPVGKVRFTK